MYEYASYFVTLIFLLVLGMAAIVSVHLYCGLLIFPMITFDRVSRSALHPMTLNESVDVSKYRHRVKNVFFQSEAYQTQ